MFRTVLSALAVAVLLIALPSSAAFAQTKSGSSRSAAKPVTTGIVNLNPASATELETLPGVGPRTAALIVEYRQKNGPFKKVEELMNVRGIGEKNFLKLKSHISISNPPKADHEQARQQ